MVSFDVMEVCDIGGDEFKDKHVIIAPFDVSLLVALERLFFFADGLGFSQDFIKVHGVSHLLAHVLEYDPPVRVEIIIYIELGISIEICISIDTDFGFKCTVDQASFLFSLY